MPSKNNKGKGKLIVITLLCLSILALFYFTICSKQCRQNSLGKEEEEKDPGPGQSKKFKPSAYYCIDKHSTYHKQKEKHKNNLKKLQSYYVEKHEAKYNLSWEKKGDDWHLDTSNWSFSLKSKKGEKVKPRWSKKPCTLNKNKTQVHCPVVYYQGILWKLKFSQFEGGFIKIELYRVPVSKEAKQKKQMARFFGVKERNDIDICLRNGYSPIREILSAKKD